jgi:hypothetical protein
MRPLSLALVIVVGLMCSAPLAPAAEPATALKAALDQTNSRR